MRDALEVANDTIGALQRRLDDALDDVARLHREKMEFVEANIALRTAAPRPEGREQEWRDPKAKPPHLPGEHHSQDVLICMKDAGWTDGQNIRIGHVSCGHWRPRGGNGNFDDDVLGWMPLPRQLPQEGSTNK